VALSPQSEKSNRRIGSSLDDFLKEKGLFKKKGVVAWLDRLKG
jgi:hypothetical protein